MCEHCGRYNREPYGAKGGYHGKTRKNSSRKGTIHQSGINLPNLKGIRY